MFASWWRFKKKWPIFHEKEGVFSSGSIEEEGVFWRQIKILAHYPKVFECRERQGCLVKEEISTRTF
ncbi:MAG: hypothetical protein FJZ58_08000 [Chlamydiae bacterium]|nr:hypothetical protein [Chlamydiota bacterium]